MAARRPSTRRSPRHEPRCRAQLRPSGRRGRRLHGDLFEPSVLASLWGGDPRLPTAGIHVPPAVDFAHRGLLAAARTGDDPVGAADRAIDLAAAVLEQAEPDRVASGGPSSATARNALADAAREALSLDPNLSLGALARLVAISPHHLSRVFRAETGHTIARHRMRLRTRAALERWRAASETSLASPRIRGSRIRATCVVFCAPRSADAVGCEGRSPRADPPAIS